MRRAQRGFTLVELLVVLAIVAVLAALLFPVFANAKKSAQNSSALGQLMQIGHGIALYASEHDDMLPYASGNNCYHLAVNLNRGCGTADAEAIRKTLPINAALQRQKVPWNLFRSPVDTMSRVLLQEPGHRSTWYEETRTPNFPGSSFEYTLLGLRRTALSTIASPSAVVTMSSLYTLDGADPKLHHALFADGHCDTVPGANSIKKATKDELNGPPVPGQANSPSTHNEEVKLEGAVGFEIHNLHIPDDSAAARVTEAIVAQEHVTPSEAVRMALQRLGEVSPPTGLRRKVGARPPKGSEDSENIIGMFAGQPEVGAAIDAVIASRAARYE